MSMSTLFAILGPETCKQLIREQDAAEWDNKMPWEGMEACCGCGETLDGQRVCCQPDAEGLHKLGEDCE